MICGSNIINQCNNVTCEFEGLLPGNARYCPYCGSTTSFYTSGYLNDWDDITKNGVIYPPEVEETFLAIESDCPF